ncbi:UTP--glucose-1-phosphate uridylyltransferase GalU [Falsibacillus albus]|uniref:UTP--glucose-1-phosphate uridylyltransferase GalU n=1 Tax=Falsibacillus albus TaxID=2478915 RepID=UPI001F41EDC2|nr:UTP--glucose-1-phosphate uridylyltransferase GalU [Falsibacillus albus]
MSNQIVKKAIIPAAGLGTRFLPATKAQPKEMLPIVDKPTIQYIIEEAAAAGIEDIIIVTGRGKRAIEDHFDKSYELEEFLFQKGKYHYLESVQRISDLANIHYIRQKEPLGLGHAISCARSFIGDDPFAVLLGDDIVKSSTPCIQQLITQFNRVQHPIIGVQPVEKQSVSKYGVITPSHDILPQEDLLKIKGLVEKPETHLALSNLAIMGRYVLTPDIFPILHSLSPGAGGEYQLTDALNQLNQQRPVYALQFEGMRFDVGDKLGFIKATVDFALNRPELKEEVFAYLETMINKITSGGGLK